MCNFLLVDFLFVCCLFFFLVTDENSESDSDTEEKLKGEVTGCHAGGWGATKMVLPA